jgi:hypothetical protein
MIIRLSSSFDTIARAELEALADIFEMLLNSHRAGAHVFVPVDPILTWITEPDSGFSRTQRACADEIWENVSIYRGLAKDAQFAVLVVPTGDQKIPERINDRIVVNIETLKEGGALERARVLVENALTDAAFFQTLCRCFATELGFSRKLSIDFMHGGGATTGQQYELAAAQHRPTLCIVDSDRCSWDSALGDTAQAVRRVCGTEIASTVTCRILPVREVENWIPLEISKDMYAQSQDIQETIDLIERLHVHDRQRPNNEMFVRWFDFKRGLKRSDFKNPKCAASHAFLQQMWTALDPTEDEFEIDDYPAEQETICGGISQRLLERFIEYTEFSKNDSRVRGEIKRGFFYEEIRDLVALILAFSARPDRSWV